jgi:hypothetical protein
MQQFFTSLLGERSKQWVKLVWIRSLWDDLGLKARGIILGSSILWGVA